jgi:hypothetical protein
MAGIIFTPVSDIVSLSHDARNSNMGVNRKGSAFSRNLNLKENSNEK